MPATPTQILPWPLVKRRATAIFQVKKGSRGLGIYDGREGAG